MHEFELLTPQEVSKILKVSLRTVQRLIRNGQIPAVRVGRQWRIPKAALMARLGIPVAYLKEAPHERRAD